MSLSKLKALSYMFLESLNWNYLQLVLFLFFLDNDVIRLALIINLIAVYTGQ